MNDFIINNYLKSSNLLQDSYFESKDNKDDKDDKEDKDKKINSLCDILNNKKTDVELYKQFYDILKNNFSIQPDRCTISDNVYYDLEIFSGLNGHENNSIFNSINYTITTFGKIHLQYKLYNPTNNKLYLNNQNLKNIFFIKNDIYTSGIINRLKNINSLENDIEWIWNNNLDTEEFKVINSLVYFESKHLQFINTNTILLNIIHLYTIYLSPTIGIISPLISAIMPFIILRYYFKLDINLIIYLKLFIKAFYGMGEGIFALVNKQSFTKYFKYVSGIFTAVFYIYSIYNSIKTAINTNKIIRILHKKLNGIYKFIKEGLHIYSITRFMFSSNTDITETIKSIEKLITLKDQLSIYNDTINSQTLGLNKGIILTKIKYVISIKNLISHLLNYIGLVDYHINNYTLYFKEFTICEYLNNPIPQVNFNAIWHPSFNNDKYVRNNSVIDHNFLITGPNASGKSTYIKSVGISVLLGQTIGLCNANYYSLTPFKLINTYINIPDCKGKESLFQAEMNRCIYYLDNVKSLKNYEKGFNIMDEVFSGTNPNEGLSGAYSYLYELSKYDNHINLVTTHYDYLSKLEEETTNFKNYHFKIIMPNNNNNNEIVFTYKIQGGKSTTKIALELLNQSCFNEEMLNKSLDIYNIVSKINY